MREVDLKRVKEMLDYDANLGLFFWRAKPNRRIRVCDVAGTTDKDGYIVLRVDGKQYFAHRVAWLLEYGTLPEHGIDHIDGLPHNNRLSNLRIATQAENNQNRHGPQTNNKSGSLGVCWHGAAKKWRAIIHLNRKQKHLGSFANKSDAIAAYKTAKQQFHPFAPK